MNNDRIYLTEKISYIKASNNPLSADVGIIEGENNFWIYDVGSNYESAKQINELSKPANVIISHFHPDHTANLVKINYNNLFVSLNSYKHLKCGDIVDSIVGINDGLDLKIILLPSSHAKGSLAFEVCDKYIFVGDGIYSAAKSSGKVYNTNLLLKQIRLLKSLSGDKLLLSHTKNFVYEKNRVIEILEDIYSKRSANSPYIECNVSIMNLLGG